MSSATLTLLGLNRYAAAHGINMFEHLELPDAVDKEVCVQNILLQCGMYELLYPDLDFMVDAIDLFSKKYQRTFNKWAEVMNTEYKPLANYDRIEQWSDSTSTSTSESTETSMSDHVSRSENISAFNSDTLKPNTSAAEQNDTAGHQDKIDQVDSLSRHDGQIWGNIGVMTTQAIFKEEWELDKLNIYDEIMKLFAREFVIPFTY